jgi:hypothetical protein
MATQDTKIINFEAAHSKQQKEGQKAPLNRIIPELRSIYSRHVTELLQRLFAVIDDELFKRSDKSESLVQQSLYFSAMRHIRVECSCLQSNVHLHISRRYDDFWKRKASALELNDTHEAPKEEDFSLLENEVLEEEIAISAMIEKGNNLFQSQLYSLNKRVAFLLEREDIDTNENPLSPHALCNAFSSALKSLPLDLTIKLLIYKLFDQVVLSALGKLYHELNAFLINEGVLPTLAKNIRRQSNAFSGASQGLEGAGEDGFEDNQQAYIEVFQGMQRLLDGWRTQMGLLSAYGDNGRNGTAFDTGEVLSALNVLQSPATLPYAAPLGSGEGLKSYITEQLTALQPGEAKPLARPEEDIIDMVALIFDFILEDRNLPDPIKGLIARLQIPVVKVAIIEKSFFGRKNHPVRLLLNALAQAGIGLDTAEGVTDTPVFKKIENIVTRILDEFDQNVGLFSELLDDFMAFMEKEVQRSRIAEERTRQVTQSKEQLHLAKRKIAYEIATRLESKATPAAVRSFLYNIWKDVLVLAYLRRDKQPGDWENALTVMDTLIWSVVPSVDAATRKAIIQAIPRLLKSIRTGLESISLDPQSVATALKDLETCHVMRLSKPVHETQAPESAPDAARADEEDNCAVEIRDPELAQAITEIRGNLPDIENLTVQDLCRAPGEIGVADFGADFIVEDEYLFKARELEVGQWVEFDDGKKRVRGKLSWKSQVTSTYVFVNRKGAKILEIALSDLAKRMGADTARVIEDAGVPLMDRAFGALLSKLKTPVAKPA